jgi:lipopolysaccharide export system protein LptA
MNVTRLLTAIAATFLLGPPALAQGANVSFGSEEHDSTQPVEVTSDRLDIDQTGGTAVFIGNVIVVQGDLTLTADRVRVEYGQAEPREIERIFATGNVTLVSPTEAAEGDEAVYEVATRSVVMTGDVLLTQSLNAVAGERLTIDLETGTGVVEGRVRTVLRSERQ